LWTRTHVSAVSYHRSNEIKEILLDRRAELLECLLDDANRGVAGFPTTQKPQSRVLIADQSAVGGLSGGIFSPANATILGSPIDGIFVTIVLRYASIQRVLDAP
jgi:hypothetical protein